MAKILNNPSGNQDRVIVQYSPEEILPKTFGVENSNQPDSPVQSGFMISNAIQSIAWKDLWANAPHIVKGKKLKYGNVTVLEGNYVVTFYNELPVIEEPAPEAK
jgi:hypothetical protein